ncbi:MAG TPA: hypothetical protein VNQ55_03300 [Parapedobacter sp.]|nr:hypothetical protein [Parapedobacter sp.]
MRKAVVYPWGKLLLLVVLAGCNTDTRDFEWSEDIAELTGKDLGSWLRQAPFSNELAQREENKMVFTNAQQVFPFMGRYYNAVEELRYARNEPDNPIYWQETVLYQDPDWGDLFVNATLLYDDAEVFLDRHYSESGNVVFEGTEAAMGNHSATLTETAVSARGADYKTAIYWASTGGECYLLGFYQQDNLIFEAAIPLLASDTSATLAKLNAVNEKLELNIAEWQQATVQQLAPSGTHETFWKDPFVGLYPEKRYMLDKVQLKVKDTPFQQVRPAVTGDYYFSYDKPAGKVVLYTALRETEVDREAFDAENEDLPAYETNGRHVYYEEQEAGERVKGVAKTYFGSGQYLELTYEYPRDDPEAKAHVHGILKHVKVSRIL